MTETSRNCLLLDSGLGEFPPRPGVSVEPLDSLWSGNQDLIRGLLPTIWRSMQPSNLTPPLMLENFLHRLFQALSFCHMFSVWNLNGTPLLPVLIHVDVKYSWGLLGWKHMHKATGGVLGVIMHRSVSLPVHPCTNEQTGVLLLSCCPVLAPSTSPACLLASPLKLSRLHWEMDLDGAALPGQLLWDALLLYAIIIAEGSGKNPKPSQGGWE